MPWRAWRSMAQHAGPRGVTGEDETPGGLRMVMDDDKFIDLDGHHRCIDGTDRFYRS